MIDRAMRARIVYIGVVMGAVSLLAIDVFLPGGLVTLREDSLATACTVGFTTLVFAQLFNVLNSPSAVHSAFRNLLTNRWLWASLLLALALQVAVVHVPVLQVAFATEPLNAVHWAIAVGMSSLVL